MVSDDIVRQFVETFAEVAIMDLCSREHLPRVTSNKKLQELCAAVDQYIESALSNEMPPSFIRCINLYAATNTVCGLLSTHHGHTCNGSWRSRLESRIVQLRKDLSRLVAIEYPPRLVTSPYVSFVFSVQDILLA